ncbi:MAG: cyclic-phosphate processing receiver domain-containing protein [Calditrichia bacterium]
MKIYLDDERTPPPGWLLLRWPDEVIEKLKLGNVTHLSLDHDLGDDERGTGYDVVLWLEEAVATRGFVPPTTLKVHSANSSARLKMEAGLKSIRRLAAEGKNVS